MRSTTTRMLLGLCFLGFQIPCYSDPQPHVKGSKSTKASLVTPKENNVSSGSKVPSEGGTSVLQAPTHALAKHTIVSDQYRNYSVRIRKAYDSWFTAQEIREQDYQESIFTRNKGYSRKDGYLKLADQLNFKFIRATYNSYEGAEKKFVNNFETSFRRLTNFKVKLKPEPMKLRFTSRLYISENHRIDLETSEHEQSILYKVEVPFEKITSFFGINRSVRAKQ